jgi:hypothetical protein
MPVPLSVIKEFLRFSVEGRLYSLLLKIHVNKMWESRSGIARPTLGNIAGYSRLHWVAKLPFALI